MTDPNLPPERVVHQTTINTAPPPRKGGGAGLAFLVGGLLVAVAVIAWFVFAGGRAPAPETPNLDVDISVPRRACPTFQIAPPRRNSPAPARPLR